MFRDMRTKYAPLAQLVEQLTLNQWVRGSSPRGCTKIVMVCKFFLQTVFYTATKQLGFKILQFNAVVESNIHARHLYERLGLVHIGTVPNAFRMKDGTLESICLYYHRL